MRKVIFLDIGYKSHRLTVVSFAGVRKGHRMYKCLCDCGNETIVRGSAILSNNTFSCGCYDRETRNITLARGRGKRSNGALKDGKKTPEYEAFMHMKSRCYNKKDYKYKNYGGRGITVCERWVNSFTNFLNDMGLRPSKNHSIDRIDVNGNYMPENCRWALSRVQANNKTNSVYYIFNNEKMCQSHFAQLIGVSDHAVEYHSKMGKNPVEIVQYYEKKYNRKIC